MNRPLRTMGFDESTNGVLERKKFTIAEQIVGRPIIELLFDLDLPLPVIQDLMRMVSLKVSPEPISILDLLKRRDSYIPTQLSVLDAYLRGGISIGAITEVIIHSTL